MQDSLREAYWFCKGHRQLFSVCKANIACTKYAGAHSHACALLHPARSSLVLQAAHMLLTLRTLVHQ
jgi:hypothetical protein